MLTGEWEPGKKKNNYKSFLKKFLREGLVWTDEFTMIL